MAPKMSTYDSRQRAKEAFDHRANRLSWREICDRLGYRSVGAAQSAVNRYAARERREPTTTTIETHKAGIEIRTRAMTQRFAAAFRSGDDNTLASLNREIIRNEAELAKLSGLYEPETVNINVGQQTPESIISEARQRLLAAVAQQPALPTIEGEVVL